jgi:hypothetical protein
MCRGRALSACYTHFYGAPIVNVFLGSHRFMVVLKSAQVSRIRHAVQSPTLWQGRKEKTRRDQHFALRKYYQSASHRTSKSPLRKEKFLWLPAFSGISSLASSSTSAHHTFSGAGKIWPTPCSAHSLELRLQIRLIYSRAASAHR